MRKVYATVTLDLIIRADDDASTSDTINEAASAMCINGEKADVEEATVRNIVVTDSK